MDYSKQGIGELNNMKNITSYVELNPDIYGTGIFGWKLDDGIEEIGFGSAFGGISVIKTNVFRVYKRGKNKDSFLKKQYFFSNFYRALAECLVNAVIAPAVTLTG